LVNFGLSDLGLTVFCYPLNSGKINFFRFRYIVNQSITFFSDYFLKKYFGSLEKGCTFASAFAQKTGVEKKRQLFETDEKIEIACV
jgi:hypothetical protein